MKELMDKIKDADYVLVGIGEEFQVDYQKIREIPKYRNLLKESDEHEENQWIQPYLIHDYIRNHTFQEQEEAYDALADILEEKDYFIVSTSTDDLIRKSKLDQNKIVTPCGSFYFMQCEDNCGAEVEYGEPVANSVTREMFVHTHGLSMVERPRCEKCNSFYVFNTIYEEKYDEKGYGKEWQAYSAWLQKTVNRKLVILELGVGMLYPSVIRWAFEKTSMFNKKSYFCRVNRSIYQLSEQTEGRGIGVEQSPYSFLKELAKQIEHS